MTRINLLPVSELNNVHLMAEYRELPMVPAALKRSLRTQSKEIILKKNPKIIHSKPRPCVSSFNKLGYLSNRYEELIVEAEEPGDASLTLPVKVDLTMLIQVGLVTFPRMNQI